MSARPTIRPRGEELEAVYLNVRERLRQRRELRDLRLVDVARETGISKSTLSRVERGSGLDLPTFRALCIWLGDDPRELLMLPSALLAGAQDGAP